jgi:hypothetical protein
MTKSNNRGLPAQPRRRSAPGGYQVRNNEVYHAGRKLSNFSAEITKDTVIDNGADVVRSYTISAKKAARGGRISDSIECTVPAAEFVSMQWVCERLGSGYIVEPGNLAKDRLRAGIQHFSRNTLYEQVYGHTGWRQVNGIWVFLHGGGALGGGGEIRTDLSREQLDRYSFADYRREDIREAVGAALALLELGPGRIIYPLLAAAYRAPLCHFLPCTVMPHFVGETQSFKSSVVALLVSHFGRFPGKEALPGNWRFTQAILEKLLFLAKDVLFPIDDLHPEDKQHERERLEGTFTRVVGAIGDDKGRRRAGPGMESRPEYLPRGLALSTGEYTPQFAQSRQSRVLVIPVKRGDISCERLTRHQARTEMLRSAMAGFIDWLRIDFEDRRFGSGACASGVTTGVSPAMTTFFGVEDEPRSYEGGEVCCCGHALAYHDLKGRCEVCTCEGFTGAEDFQ